MHFEGRRGPSIHFDSVEYLLLDEVLDHIEASVLMQACTDVNDCLFVELHTVYYSLMINSFCWWVLLQARYSLLFVKNWFVKN